MRKDIIGRMESKKGKNVRDGSEDKRKGVRKGRKWRGKAG